MSLVVLKRYAILARDFCRKDWFPSFAILMIMMSTLIVAMLTFMMLPVSAKQPASDQKAAEARQKAIHKAHAKEEADAAGNTYVLPELVTNVGDSSGSRFVVANLTLVGMPKSFAVANEAKIMDLSSGILARLKPDVLEKPSNRKMLKTELLTELERVLGGAYVKDIYFTRLAIQ
jgi:flagellar basal body-associated protein FliL